VPRLGDPQSLNRFSYVSNNPIMRIDPSGHSDYRARMNRLRKAYGNKTWKENRKAYHRYGDEALPDMRDLTSWLVKALNYMADSSEISQIQ
jgi:hypothetical protein